MTNKKNSANLTPPQDLSFKWPRITDDAKNAILEQLHKSISIYDKSGVIAKFEDEFSKYHNQPYGLLSNSGTSAIFSMFEGINLLKEDEVLCPVYTFHATVSPLVYFGARPIFCDSDKWGNISFQEIKKKYTKKTRAVIVTHMWGRPVGDIQKIAAFCKEKKIWLLEDCSHAHGASIYNKRVGSFGDAAAWSLQGQKTITGGEGGIMLTNNQSIYERALLQGHYNKRPKQEIEKNDDLYKYSLTGLGLKLRAHPLAIALALQQFRHIEEFLSQRQVFAKKITEALSDIDFLELPDLEQASSNSWYAYTLLFDSKRAGISREEFVKLLHDQGLTEIDIPGSTALLNELPLFTNPEKLISRMYQKPLPKQNNFPYAKKFSQSLIKMPVWTFVDEEPIVDAYIEGVVRVAKNIRKIK